MRGDPLRRLSCLEKLHEVVVLFKVDKLFEYVTDCFGDVSRLLKSELLSRSSSIYRKVGIRKGCMLESGVQEDLQLFCMIVLTKFCGWDVCFLAMIGLCFGFHANHGAALLEVKGCKWLEELCKYVVIYLRSRPGYWLECNMLLIEENMVRIIRRGRCKIRIRNKNVITYLTLL